MPLQQSRPLGWCSGFRLRTLEANKGATDSRSGPGQESGSVIFDRSDDAPQAMQAVRGRTDSREVELKLEFDPAALDDLVGHPLVRDRIEGPVRSETIYYDTPGHGLRKAGIS